MLREQLESLKHALAQTQCDWDHTTKGKKGSLPDLAYARDVVEDLLVGLTALEALVKDAQVKLPIVAHKTTIYTPEGPSYPWVASTCSSIVGQLHNTERDETRAVLFAKSINFLFAN